jgi:16S rRNA (uracil1498-N3)-methyltransferase
VQRPRFFTAQALCDGITLDLEPEPARHIARTLRMQAGDTLVLFDGDGLEYPGEIIALDKRTVRVRCASGMAIDRESPLQVELGIGLSRGERMDWVVQKATELGVQRIAPLLSTRALRLPGERSAKKREHWQRIARSACEQCGRNRVPEVLEPQALPKWLEQLQAPLRLVLDPRAAAQPLPAQAQAVALLCGPEGGLDEDEVRRAVDAGFSPLALGPRVLRTETAPVAALAVLQAKWGDIQLS